MIPRISRPSFFPPARLGALLLLAFLPALPLHAGETFRLMCYNIHHGEGMDKKLDLARIAELIKSHNPDAVALQEVDKNCGRTGKVDQPAEFARLTGMNAYFQKAMDYDGGEYGICLLTRGKALEVKGYVLPNSEKPVEPRTAQAIKIEALSGTLTVANTHLDVSAAETRLAQAEFLMKSLTGIPGTVILAGDFNSLRADASLKAMETAGWALPQKQGNPNTIPAGTPKREIDFAAFHPAASLKVIKYLVLDEALASDHRPILIEVERASP